MTTWLESTNVHQDGTPVTRKIKIPEMGEEIWWTDNAYAEVSNDVADILANNIDSISKVAEPSSPGTYYGDANSNTTIQINISDGVFDAITAESIASDAIDTGEINTNAHFVAPSEGQSGLEDAVASATDGDSIYVLGGVLDIDTPPFEVNKTIHFRALGDVTLRLADGAYDDTGSGQSVIRFVSNSHGSSIKGFEIDGNLANQTFSAFPDSAHAHGIRIGGSNIDGGTMTAEDVVVEDCYIHDTIRSGLVGDVKNNVWRDVIIENCATDHWVYVAAGSDNVVENVTCRGFARNSGIVLGDSGPYVDNTLRSITVEDLASNPHDSDVFNIVGLRSESSSGGTLIEDLTVNNSSGSVETELWINSEVILRDVTIRTRDRPQIINLKSGSEGSVVEGCKVEIANNVDANTTHPFKVQTSDITLRNISAIETTGAGISRGINVSGGTEATENITIDGARFDVGGYHYRLGGPINKMWTEGVHVVRSGGVNVSGTVWWADNQYASESASAEVPQGDYAEGTIVDFTDTGDDSGTGRYLITRANGPVLL